MSVLSKRRRWIEWIVIALVVAWIGTIAWRRHVKGSFFPSRAPEVADEAR